MPSGSSTLRRHRLAVFLDSFGSIAMKKCSTCAKHGRICKVHIRSGKCNECVRRGQRCDLQVTRSEFDRLIKEKSKLQQGISEAVRAQEEADEALQKALDARRTARAREERLRRQLDLIDSRASDAIAVESEALVEPDQRGGDSAACLCLESGPEFSLSPSTWNALDGLDDSFWDSSRGVVGESAAEAVGSS
jgi:hypothetical protein